VNTTRDPRFPTPMHHARQVTQLEHDRQQYEVGQRIAYDVRVYDYKKDRTHDERREGRHRRTVDRGLARPRPPYAECLTDEGTGSRVWFHRDKPGTPMGVTGRILPDALF
jgi:hypothetical protein